MDLRTSCCLAISLLLLLLYSSGVTGVDIVLFNTTDQTVYAPLNSVQRFNCTGLYADDPTSMLITVLKPDGTNQILQFTPRWEEELNERQIHRNITHSSGNFATVIVTIQALERNNGTELQCQVGEATNSVSYTVTLLVYDQPMAPSELRISVINAASINVSWPWSALQIFPEVKVTFTLTVLNVNSTSESNSQQTINLQEPYYVFSAPFPSDASACDEYLFQVTATNGAGTSESSESQISMLPSLPMIGSVNATLDHTVSKSELNGIFVDIHFDAASACSQYPVTHYHVVAITNEEPTPSVIGTFPASGFEGKENIELQFSKDVQENTLYTFSIMASNEVGNVTSISKQCYTSDVHTVVAVEDIENRTLRVECHFIRGSNALGCLVVFESEAKNKTIIVNRDNNTSLVATEIMDMNEFDETCYHRVFGFDIEADGSTSELALPGENGLACSTVAPTTLTSTLGLPKGAPAVLTIVVGVSAIVGITAIVIILVVVMLFCKHVVAKRKKDSNPEPSSFTNPFGTNQTLQSPSDDDMQDHIYDNEIEMVDVDVKSNAAYGVCGRPVDKRIDVNVNVAYGVCGDQAQ